MAVNGKKTLAEHKEFVERLARVSFYFVARWLRERFPDETLGILLREHTPLMYHALNYLDYETRWNNPDCLWIMSKADESWRLPASEFEEAMWSEIKELAMERAEKFYPESVGVQVPPDYNAGSLKYDPPATTRPPNYCNFHIANAISPESIFDDPNYLPECFHLLMDKSEREYGFDTLVTGTWLNDNPRWLALFPCEWIDNMQPRSDNIGWTFGEWGQMVTARGTFNDKAGNRLRETGELKYKSRHSRCSFLAMRRHLSRLSSSRSSSSV